MSINNKVLEGLTPGDRITDIYAYLIDGVGKEVFNFLYNPEQKEFSRSAKYSSSVTALTSLPSQQYSHTTGLILQLSDLLLESHSEGKTCKLLLQRLQGLMVADPSKGKYAPSPVTFKWGKDTFGPAVITNLKWVETGWLGGEVASARVDITLEEVPATSSPNKSKSEAPGDRLQTALNKTNLLTDRQVDEASVKANQWLKSNTKKLSESISNLVKSGNYKISVTKNGTISMFSNKNKSLGTVGLYKNDKLDVSSSSLIKK